MTDYTDPATIDLDEVISNIRHQAKRRQSTWTDERSWPNVTVLALAEEVVALRRELEFIELLADGGSITVNGTPWREMYERLAAMVSDHVRRRSVLLSDKPVAS